TIVLVYFFYKEKEFCRVGYYVNNEFEGIDPTTDIVTKKMIDVTKVVRTLSEAHVTIFPCFWDKEEQIAIVEEKPEELGTVVSFTADGNIMSNSKMEEEEPAPLSDEVQKEIHSALGVDVLLNTQNQCRKMEEFDELEYSDDEDVDVQTTAMCEEKEIKERKEEPMK
ncbi:hypothetical protein EIN_251950, partial [Entamoeba invadens IP1]